MSISYLLLRTSLYAIKRAHRLITRGAAVESVAPEVRPLSEQGFYSLAEQIFSMPEVREAVRAAAQREGE